MYGKERSLVFTQIVINDIQGRFSIERVARISHKLVQVYGSTTGNPSPVDTDNGSSWGTKCMAPRSVVVLKSYAAITLAINMQV